MGPNQNLREIEQGDDEQQSKTDAGLAHKHNEQSERPKDDQHVAWTRGDIELKEFGVLDRQPSAHSASADRSRNDANRR